MSIDPHGQARASDDERERVASVLREQHVVGRLSVDELNERLEAAYGARTRGELDVLTRDLPVPVKEPDVARAPVRKQRSVPVHLRVHFAVYLVFVVFWILIWVLSGGGYFWPVWPALGWGLGVGIHAAVAVAGGSEAVAQTRSRSQAPSRTATATAAPPPPANRPSRRWVSVMFTDIANSTTLTEALGDEQWSRFLVRHREMVRDICRSRGGTEISTQGDGFLMEFPDPQDAVRAAIDLQRRIETERSEGGIVPHLRVGIHAGEAVVEDNDLLGRTVNLAARVSGEARPGEILVTEPVADLVDSWARLSDRGVQNLRGVTRPRHLFAVEWSGV